MLSNEVLTGFWSLARVRGVVLASIEVAHNQYVVSVSRSSQRQLLTFSDGAPGTLEEVDCFLDFVNALRKLATLD
jgi:hypothetical protein